MDRWPKTVAAAALVMLAACRGNDSPAARMRAMAPRAGRTIEARLTQFGWSAMRVQRGTQAAAPLDPARLELAAAAGAVIEKTPGGRDAGVGYLIIDRDADAVEALQEAAQRSPDDAKVWSDLAAARHTLAVRGNKPHQLPLALAAADRALRLQPALPDALFNRALIIERLGITEAARRAWQRYLQADGTSPWANEALEHLGRLSVTTSDAGFRRDFDRATAAIARGDATALGALTRTYPQEARKWGEGPLLAQWADASRTGDGTRAKAALDVVRTIARALAESNHEELLADAVAAIDKAASDPQRLRMLADAQAIYRDGRIVYSKRRIAESQQLLRRAADMFSAAGTPMALSARYYVANTLYDENRSGEAEAMLRGLLAAIDPQRYRGLAAHIEWEMSLCQMGAGAWEGAIRSVEAASRTFGALGETNNRANADILLACALDHAAQPRAAWAVRVHAFADLSHGEPWRIAAALPDAIRAEAHQGHYDGAVALSELLAPDLQADAPAVAMACVNRARLFVDTGDLAAARNAVSDARQATARIADAALRARVSVYLDIAGAVTERTVDPAGALAALNSALTFFISRNERASLPDVYLQRGRTYVQARNAEAALADFDAGVRELEALRTAFDQSALRSGFYDTASDLFVESIALRLRRNEVAQAFAIADGSRARTLSEQMAAAPSQTAPASLTALGSALHPETAVIEYALLRDSLAVFYASHVASGVEIISVDSAAMRRTIERVDDLLQRRGDAEAARRELASLDRLLIAPLLPRLRGVKRLAIVPDRQLSAVPFAALYDAAAQQYRIEDFSMSIAPSARFLMRPADSHTLSPALVVGDPTSDGGPALPEAAHEAEAIAALYSAATLLTGDRATRARFVQSAEGSALIHYAGHAQSDAATAYGTLSLAADDSPGTGALEAEDIARLRLRRAPLVVLAACGTIRGDADHVEGMPSVARAFLAAGARAVIGTLWEIDDDVAGPLFRTLHRRLRDGAPAATALRDAQLALLHSGNAHLQHPASWAPIEVLGRHD